MKRLLGLLLAAVVLALPASVWAAPGPALIIDQQPVTLASGMVVQGERLLAPLQPVAEALGAAVAFDKAKQMATVVRGHHSIVLWAGSSRAVVNGASRSMDVEPRMNGDVLWVPVRFLAEHLGGYVTYDSAKSQVIIETGKHPLAGALAAAETVDNVKHAGTMRFWIERQQKPPTSPPVHTTLEWTAHLYEKQLLMRMSLAASNQPMPVMLSQAIMDGRPFILSPTRGEWQLAKVSPDTLRSQSTGGLMSRQSLLGAGVVSVLGTEEFAGVTLLKVALDVPESTSIIMGDVLGTNGALALPSKLKMKVDYFRSVFWINPANSLIHRSTFDMAVTITVPGQQGQPEPATLHMTGETSTTPTNEPVSFPTVLPE